jgi:hypothetical protein
LRFPNSILLVSLFCLGVLIAPRLAYSQTSTKSSKTQANPPGQQAAGISAKTKPSREKLNIAGKFKYFAVESFRPGSLVIAGLYSAYDLANPPKSYPREWRQGIGGFGRNYGDFMASWTAVQGGKFLIATVVREDPRYLPSTSKNIFARSLHALTFVFVDKSDNGHNRIAVSNFAGALAGGFVGNTYLPDGFRNVSHAEARSALALTGFATSNLADEFQPELKGWAKKLHIPFVGR